MCGIFGAILNDPGLDDIEELHSTWDFVEDRGRDSWGLRVWDGEKVNFSTNQAVLLSGLLPRRENYVMVGNRRGMPTSEWVDTKDPNNIQPFTSPSGRWIFTHNGTIANDKALCKRFSVDPPTSIDTYSIGVAFDNLGFYDGIRALQGSFAILAIDTQRTPDRLYYATNYKPLYVKGCRDGGGILFASQERHLWEPDWISSPGPRALEQYTMGYFEASGTYEVQGLYPIQKDRVLVVCSGGLDSATAAWKYHKEGMQTELLHFRYGCKAEGPEVEAVEELAKAMNSKVHYINSDFFSKHADSPLTNEEKINYEGGGEAGMEFAHEWVPARNTVMLAMAAAYAESHGFTKVVLGGNMEEAGAYPDNEEEFINRWNLLAPYVARPYHRLKFEAPLATMVKHEIVKLGLEIGVPYELTWSCYQGKEGKPCDSCGPCYMRRKAFEMNGSVDPLLLR